MKKKELIAKCAKSTGISNVKAAAVIDAFLEEISASLSEGEKVMLSGFGTFESKPRSGRVGRHPISGEDIILPSSTVVSFHQSTKLREKVNK